MHRSSYQHMQLLVEKYLDSTRTTQVYDLGSYDVNGCYRPLFDQPDWTYHGIDLETGPNVDIVLDSPYRLPLSSRSADVIISGQAFEHIEYFWLTWLEFARVLKVGGMIFLLAPSRGPEHRYPVDCWRFYPDSYRALAKYGALDLLEVQTDWHADNDVDSAAWGDTVGVFRKTHSGWKHEFKLKLHSMFSRLLLN
ncbi:MAG: methyltransferase domain-containing protein [Thermodesulfobacteriota bacterium]|nr:methyltransferase domain-containing protein [Thermodesulfobacteriota bacterium]